MPFAPSPEVAAALAEGRPIVALESTIISHGLPRPQNLEVAREVEDIVRDHGAVPATIAVLDGVVHVGLTDDQLKEIANRDDIAKASSRDLAIISATGKSAATTVAATAHLAALAGIRVFATGGLGGVHRDANETFDESADLTALSQLDITVVCAGVKSILDVAATLERLETLAIGVVGYKTTSFPGFYLTDSGFTIEHSVQNAADIAKIIRAREALRTNKSALIVANPVKHEMDRKRHDAILKSGLAAARKAGIIGKAVTPFLLEHFHTTSQGESLSVNIEIIKSNSALAADIAVAKQHQ
ncbi:MAG: pseudouridine-5-phosphate glycosidase [Actinobacteria bacterium]|nr:pseudouridine-5-phosphate glycosidase [Actinomycetota bacterium]MSV70543.1 pseudouridine-5-phosphate glycosidase [Actinomycetota bacterium]MSW13043.1 pseudouridine-5-phosphate glycosidase [Actinomycetota bacterium]MSX46691.1 pseudouridine-5-phosphate glycosidase [Actinomycetota bacterium]MSX90730.1 pseudouridine-5-phosphate glycosidase [Actinomycetota bacterium]